MNRPPLLSVLCILLLIQRTGFAFAPPGYWECSAFDGNNRGYNAIAKQRSKAINKAYQKCRNDSQIRSSCRTAQSYCTQGPLSLIDDRCVASDERGRTWNTTGVFACKTAVSLCTEWQFLHGNSRGSTCVVRHR